MGNINDNALPRMKTILGIEGSSSDAACLKWLEQAVYDADSKVREALSVTVEDSSYTLAPAPAATSTLWNVIVWRAVYLYRQDAYDKFLNDMQGLASIRDESTSMSRTETIRAKERLVKEAKREYTAAIFKYAEGSAFAFEEMEARESTETS